MTPHEQLKSTLIEFAPTAIEQLKEIITSGRASPKVKLDAIATLFDRVGLPAIRANITRNELVRSDDLEGLIERKTTIALEEKKVDSELSAVEEKLGKAGTVKR